MSISKGHVALSHHKSMWLLRLMWVISVTLSLNSFREGRLIYTRCAVSASRSSVSVRMCSIREVSYHCS